MQSNDGNQNFRDDVAQSQRIDPRPTLENLARSTGVSYEAVVHHALVRYAGSGAEALLAIEPWALRQLISARKAGRLEESRSDHRLAGGGFRIHELALTAAVMLRLAAGPAG